MRQETPLIFTSPVEAFNQVRKRLGDEYFEEFKRVEAELVERGRQLPVSLENLLKGRETPKPSAVYELFEDWAQWWNLAADLYEVVLSVTPPLHELLGRPLDKEGYLSMIESRIKCKREGFVFTRSPVLLEGSPVLLEAPLLGNDNKWRWVYISYQSPGNPIFWVQEPTWMVGEEKRGKHIGVWSLTRGGIILNEKGELWRQPAFYNAKTDSKPSIGKEYPGDFEHSQYGNWEPIEDEGGLVMKGFTDEIERTIAYAQQNGAFGADYEPGVKFYRLVVAKLVLSPIF